MIKFFCRERIHICNRRDNQDFHGRTALDLSAELSGSGENSGRFCNLCGFFSNSTASLLKTSFWPTPAETKSSVSAWRENDWNN
jgi:hypothetical protein